MKNYLFLLGLIACRDNSERFSDYANGKVLQKVFSNEAGYFELIVKYEGKNVKLLVYDEKSTLISELEPKIYIDSSVSFPTRNFGVDLFNNRDSCILPSNYLVVRD